MDGDVFFTVVPVLLIGFALVFGGVLLFRVPRALWARDRAVSRPGRVLEVQPRWSSGAAEGVGGTPGSASRQYYVVRASYAVGDRTFAGWSDERYYTRDWAEGDDVTLWCDPDRPDVFTLHQPRGPVAVLLGTAFLVVFLLVFIGFAIFFMRSAAEFTSQFPEM